MNYFAAQDILHLVITAELNANGELIGVEIMKASLFLHDFILESTQAKSMQLKQASYA